VDGTTADGERCGTVITISAASATTPIAASHARRRVDGGLGLELADERRARFFTALPPYLLPPASCNFRNT
jgi:hypothetical protein